MSEVTSFVGTPEEFISRHREMVAASPTDDLQRLALATSLYASGEFAEASQQAALVAPDGSGPQDASIHSTQEQARLLILEAVVRVKPVYDRAYREEYPDDEEMQQAAAAQYAQLVEILEQDDGQNPLLSF